MAIKMSQTDFTVDGNSSVYLVDGTQGSGKILVSDSNGSLSWKNTFTPTFTYVISAFPTDNQSTLTVNALPFRHYFTVGERGLLDGGHIILLPASPVEGDVVRVTNTSFYANFIYIGSASKNIYYWESISFNSSILVLPGNYLRLRSAQTIEITFAAKNPYSVSSSDSERPDEDRWYVTALSGLSFVV
jgi:hypothetical protein